MESGYVAKSVLFGSFKVSGIGMLASLAFCHKDTKPRRGNTKGPFRLSFHVVFLRTTRSRIWLASPRWFGVERYCQLCAFAAKMSRANLHLKSASRNSPCTSVSPPWWQRRAKRVLTLRFIPYSTTLLRAPSCLRALVAKSERSECLL
jgi:hypothetical protein